MRSLVLPSSMSHKPLGIVFVAIFLLIVGFNLSLIASKIYQNLAAHSLSTALTTNQPQLLSQADGYARQAIAYDRRVTGLLSYRMGIAKAGLGLNHDALVDFQAALQTDNLPESLVADLLFRMGVERVKAGESAEAREYFQRLLAMDISQLPSQTIAHANVFLAAIHNEQGGDLLVERQYLETAIHLYMDAFTVDRYLALISRMYAYGDEEHLQQALEMAVYVTRRQPSNVWTVLTRCRVHLVRQELRDATEWCQRAVKLDAKNHHAHVWLGVAYAQQELWQEALVEYETAAGIDPNNDWYRNLVAGTQAKLADE